MKTVGLLAGALGVLVGVGCGGTVIFEEDGGQGGEGAGSSTLNGPTTSVANGGNGPTTSIGTTAPATVGPGPGPTASTGPGGCGTLFEEFGFGAECNACMDAACCDELLACDVGTECYTCIFEGTCTDAANVALNTLFGDCYPQNCQSICEEQPFCNKEDFFCNDGACISQFQVCDGVFDCFEGEDEFCEDNGICGSGATTFDFELDQCLGDFCCDAFQECTDFGNDPDGCNQCLENQGGPQCDAAIGCAFESPCFGDQEFFPICGDLSVQGQELADCVNQNCCPEFEACSGGPDGPDGCAQCFENGGGPLCDAAAECFFGVCLDEAPPAEDGGGGF